MRSHNYQQFKIAPALVIALGFFSSSQVGLTQDSGRSPFIRREHERIALITHEWDQCDEISAEGLRLECTKKALASFESEIPTVNAEVRASMPKAQRAEFDTLCRSWARYFDAEKRHWLKMGKHQGTVRWIGDHNALVKVAKLRLEFLLGQLP